MTILQDLVNHPSLKRSSALKTDKRPLSEQDERARKRARTCSEDEDSESASSLCKSMESDSRSLASMFTRPGRRVSYSSSTTPILRSFISSNKSDTFLCQSMDAGFLTPPCTCSYSHGAKNGGLPLVAVGTEQGSIHVWDTSPRAPWDPVHPHSTLFPHKSGVFCSAWNSTDTLIASGAGDNLVQVSCVSENTVKASLKGHSGTVKCVAWDPAHSDILSTAGRDGGICLWDLRVEGDSGFQKPVMTILGAHEPPPKSKSRKTAVPKSVTSILYDISRDSRLVSSGSADGVLRSWDLRMVAKAPKKRLPVDFSETDSTLSHGSSRSRGILSLKAGSGPTAGLIFGLGFDRIHTYSLSNLEALKISFSHPDMQIRSFVADMAMSPCGRWLASGSDGKSPSTFVFDVSNASRPYATPHPSIHLEGAPNEGQITVVDWADGMLATCADQVIRVWRPDIDNYAKCLEAPEEMKWDWCWSEC
ncbi:WD40-repeat-containing domain protein [Mycena floridula]|nr:WD40-repeat-containing domain protein [Mycena floridula]